MKHIFTACFCLTLYTFAYTQDILPKANIIAVKGVTFQQVCTSLLDSGYSIAKKDAELQTVRTEPKVYPKHWNAAYVINVRIKDSVAYFSGTFTAPWEQPFTRAANKTTPLWNGDPVYNMTTRKGQPAPKSMIGYPFSLINNFALSFNMPVEYLKQ